MSINNLFVFKLLTMNNFIELKILTMNICKTLQI